MNIDVPIYDGAIEMVWEEGFSVRCTVSDTAVCIEANKEGLISLARHLLMLSQDDVPEFSHFHIDEYNFLENNSTELILVKKNF